MKYLKLCFLLTIPLIGSCQNTKKQTEQEEKVMLKKHEPSAKEWKVFLSKFPAKKISCLDSLQYFRHLKDTIDIILVNHMLWKDSATLDGKKWKNKSPKVIMGKDSFVYPLGGLPETDSAYRRIDIDKKPCYLPAVVFPVGKIVLSNGNMMLLFSDINHLERLYQVTVFILNREYQKMGEFGFLYGCDWQSCKYTMEEIGKNPKLLSYPTQISERGFLLHDKMVGSYFEDNLQEQFWSVEIRDDGRLEIIKEKKIYEEDSITMWSKAGYFVSDPDGYTNLRKGASTKSAVLEKLKNNTELKILDAGKDWWKVKADEKEGYVHKSRVKEGK